MPRGRDQKRSGVANNHLGTIDDYLSQSPTTTAHAGNRALIPSPPAYLNSRRASSDRGHRNSLGNKRMGVNLAEAGEEHEPHLRYRKSPSFNIRHRRSLKHHAAENSNLATGALI
ncbi:hypothetical protein Bca4012_019143 [Brassica carinata]